MSRQSPANYQDLKVANSMIDGLEDDVAAFTARIEELELALKVQKLKCESVFDERDEALAKVAELESFVKFQGDARSHVQWEYNKLADARDLLQSKYDAQAEKIEELEAKCQLLEASR